MRTSKRSSGSSWAVRDITLMLLAGIFFLLCCEPVSSTKAITYFYTDLQGSVLATTDANGVITSVKDYKPYGASAIGSGESSPGFTGNVEDGDAGFIYMQARYYDASVGVFTSVDPLGVAPANVFAFSRYAYANNNPVSNQDSTGMECESSQGGAQSGQSCPPPPPPTDPVDMAGVVVTATTTTSAGTGVAGAGSRILWAGGLVALGASLYVVDSNG